MGIIKKIKAKKKAKRQGKIIQFGLILFGFNLAFAAALFFVLLSMSLLSAMFVSQSIWLAFLPLVIIFLFAAAIAIFWYRFGQVVAVEFAHRRLWAAWVAAFISIVLLLLLLFFASLILVGLQYTSFTVALAFFGALFIILVAIAFELPIISLGVLTER